MEVVFETASIFICMGAKGKSKYNSIKIGDSFGSWTIVGQVFMDRYAKVPCKCLCGIEQSVDVYTLVSGRSKSCKPCGLSRKTASNPSWKGYQEVPQAWFSGFRRNAKLEFNIEIEDVWNLYVNQKQKCALSGLPISFKNQANRRGLRSFTASLDRIDSSKGYIKDNIQLVHKDVNIMKNAFKQDYFINICKLITNNNDQKPITRLDISTVCEGA